MRQSARFTLSQSLLGIFAMAAITCAAVGFTGMSAGWLMATGIFAGLSLIALWWALREYKTMRDEPNDGRPLWKFGKAGSIHFEDHTYEGDRPYLQTGSVDKVRAKGMRIGPRKDDDGR